MSELEFFLVSVHGLRQGLAENKVLVAFRTGGLCFWQCRVMSCDHKEMTLGAERWVSYSLVGVAVGRKAVLAFKSSKYRMHCGGAAGLWVHCFSSGASRHFYWMIWRCCLLFLAPYSDARSLYTSWGITLFSSLWFEAALLLDFWFCTSGLNLFIIWVPFPFQP